MTLNQCRFNGDSTLFQVLLLLIVLSYFFSDKRNWDAFISYSERDYKFVVHTLYPKLELEQGFKLIMHHRDFLPGESKYICMRS